MGGYTVLDSFGKCNLRLLPRPERKCESSQGLACSGGKDELEGEEVGQRNVSARRTPQSERRSWFEGVRNPLARSLGGTRALGRLQARMAGAGFQRRQASSVGI